MAIVSLTLAKTHLRITTTTHDVDVAMKLAQAEGIILDYLKTRLISIASVSIANPTVITTTVPHSLSSGVAYTISGTTTTPTVNGVQAVTVTSATTFTVPVNVTVGQSEEAGAIGAPGWTDLTVPLVVQASVLLMLSRLYEHRGDDEKADADTWTAIERLLMRQRDPALA